MKIPLPASGQWGNQLGVIPDTVYKKCIALPFGRIHVMSFVLVSFCTLQEPPELEEIRSITSLGTNVAAFSSLFT